MAPERAVLVKFGENARVVHFKGSRKCDMVPQIRDVFRDVISPDDSLLVQMRDEEWGEYIDLLEQEIPDRSKMKISIMERSYQVICITVVLAEVCFTALLNFNLQDHKADDSQDAESNYPGLQESHQVSCTLNGLLWHSVCG